MTFVTEFVTQNDTINDTERQQLRPSTFVGMGGDYLRDFGWRALLNSA
jgi:hypothetical protein